MTTPEVTAETAQDTLASDIEWLSAYCRRPLDPDQLHLPRLRRLLAALTSEGGAVDDVATNVGLAAFVAAAGAKAPTLDEPALRTGIQAALREQRRVIALALSKGPFPETLVTTAAEMSQAAGCKALPIMKALGVTLNQEIHLAELGQYIAGSAPSDKVTLEAVALETVAMVKDTPDGASLCWLIEGGASSLPLGSELMTADRGLTGEDGSGVVYLARSCGQDPV